MDFYPVRFVRTRHVYGSYRDLWALVELAGFPTCYVDEIDVSDHCVYIIPVINGEFRPHIDNQRRKRKDALLIHWYLERPLDMSWHNLFEGPGGFDSLPGYVDMVWSSDAHFVRTLNSRRVIFVPVGSDERLCNPDRSIPKEYDWTHQSYAPPRRTTIYDQLKDLSCAPNAWPPERDELLNKTRVLLHVHQSDHNMTAPLKFAFAAAAKIPLVSEYMSDPYPLIPGHDFVSDTYSNLADGVRRFLGYWPYSQEYGETLWKTLCCDFRFEDNVMTGVDDTWRKL